MPKALVVFSEVNASYTSDSELLIVEGDTDGVSRGGMLNELCAKTEWKIC